jgi:hypothetical protein
MSTGKGGLRTVLARLPSKCDGVRLFACARKTREMLGTDSAHKKGRELLCQKYRIGPKDDKLPILLPVSETAQPRLINDQPIRQPCTDRAEREPARR